MRALFLPHDVTDYSYKIRPPLALHQSIRNSSRDNIMKLFGAQTDKTLVEVLVGKFGRYVKLTRDGVNPRWLNVSEVVWRTLDRYLQEVAERMADYDRSQRESTLELTRNWSVTIRQYLDERYVTLNQYIGDRVNRMNFSFAEWEQLSGFNYDVMKALDGHDGNAPVKTPEEVIKLLKELRRPPAVESPISGIKRKSESKSEVPKRPRVWPEKIVVYGVGEEIYPTKNQALMYHTSPEKTTIDTLHSKSLAVLVGRNQFTTELNRLRKEVCPGCKIDHPSQMQHPCMMDDWNLGVDLYYDDAKKGVPFETYWERVRSVFSTLKLPYNVREARELYEKDSFKDPAKDGYVVDPAFERLINRCID